jgi:hypothetical protein
VDCGRLAILIAIRWASARDSSFAAERLRVSL